MGGMTQPRRSSPARSTPAKTTRSKPAPAARRSSSRGSALRGGIDLGGTKIEAIIVDASNKVRGSARHPTPTTGGPSDVAAAMAAAVSEAAKAAGVTTAQLAGVGVGSPGGVDTAAGTVSSARNLPGWDGKFALGQVLSEHLGTRVAVGNDVAVATDAEFVLGAARGHKNVLGVFWGTGVGGGLILGGVPYHGRGGAGEIGHMVVKDDGRRCGCGNKGCMEAYAGRASMEARARKKMDKGHKSQLLKIMEHKDRERFTSSVWAHAVEAGDKLAIELIDGAVEALGAGIASAVNLLDVELVVIGGGLGVRFGAPYVDKIRSAMHPHLFPGHTPPTVELVGLGDLGGALGAALLVKRGRVAGAASTIR
jgi:glucokinase